MKELLTNHYDLLGVSRTASADEITTAENALRKVYEDRAHRGDAEANDVLRRLNEARATLGEAGPRAEYDRRPETSRDAFLDVAYSPPIGRHAKLREVAVWLGEDPLGPSEPAPGPELFAYDALLDDVDADMEDAAAGGEESTNR